VTLCRLHLPRLYSIVKPMMAKDGFDEVQRKLEEITSELKTATDPERRRTLLREMSRLVAEAERISGQPPKMIYKQAQMARFNLLDAFAENSSVRQSI